MAEIKPKSCRIKKVWRGLFNCKLRIINIYHIKNSF